MERMVEHLTKSVGDRLVAVVAYGPAYASLLVVTKDLETPTLRALAEPVQWWIKKTGGWPRLFTPSVIERSLDVFPLEMLDISQRRRVLFGSDPFAGIAVDHAALRAQCEREMREKLMRLREGYVETFANPRALRELATASLSSFARIFRGCLALLGATPPIDDGDVITALCERLDLDAAPFFAVEDGDAAAFESYYRVLSATEARIDRLIIQQKEAV